MKPYFFSFFFILLLTLVSKVYTQQKPNVIIIYTDDQGSVDVNSYGAKDLVTPNMDYIVENGTSFTQFYASPVCSPSRASLLTGKTPQRAGLSGNAAPSSKQKKGLPGSEYTLAEMFKDAGYTTAHIGKWHLGDAPEMIPNAQGFDHSFGHMVGCIDNYSHFFYWSGPNRHDLYRNGKEVYYDGQFFPDLMVNEASNFMEDNSNNPFFIYFAVNMPHYPYQGDAKWLSYYNDKGISYGVFGRYNVAISNRLYSGLGTGLYNMNIEKNKAFLTDYKVPVYTFLEYDLNEEGSLKTSISVQLLTFDRRENGNNSVSSLTTGSMQLTYLFM